MSIRKTLIGACTLLIFAVPALAADSEIVRLKLNIELLRRQIEPKVREIRKLQAENTRLKKQIARIVKQAIAAGVKLEDEETGMEIEKAEERLFEKVGRFYVIVAGQLVDKRESKTVETLGSKIISVIDKKCVLIFRPEVKIPAQARSRGVPAVESRFLRHAPARRPAYHRPELLMHVHGLEIEGLTDGIPLKEALIITGTYSYPSVGGAQRTVPSGTPFRPATKEEFFKWHYRKDEAAPQQPPQQNPRKTVRGSRHGSAETRP